MKNIKYITYYSNNKSNIKRKANPSGEEIVNYVSSMLTELGLKTKIISLSSLTDDSEEKFITQKKENINDTVSVIYTPSVRSDKKIYRIINVFLSYIWLFFYCIKNCKKNETIIIYHSISLINIIKRLKFLKKLKIFMICEELYTVVSEQKRLPSVEKEIQYLSGFDAYLFPTKELNNIVNINNKPNIILPGVFVKEKEYNKKFNDSKIHIVYAGTFAKNKGAALSVKAGKFLSQKYILHILGFGSEEDTKNIIDLIDKTNKISKAEIKYEGILKGDKFVSFLQKCQIGLAPQTFNEKYNNTSFPSKILKYMANGLRVVTVKLPVIENSVIGKYMNYYEDNDPEKIAETIMNIDMNTDYDGFEIISSLNKKAIKELNNLLNNI